MARNNKPIIRVMVFSIKYRLFLVVLYICTHHEGDSNLHAKNVPLNFEGISSPH